ncbi:hypothetical protein ACLKA6_009149 [Drosophila palustris]
MLRLTETHMQRAGEHNRLAVCPASSSKSLEACQRAPPLGNQLLHQAFANQPSAAAIICECRNEAELIQVSPLHIAPPRISGS